MERLKVDKNREPSLHGRIFIRQNRKKLTLHYASRQHDTVFLNKNQLVSLGVRGSHPEHARSHATQIEFHLAIEENVRSPKLHFLQQLLVLRGHATEALTMRSDPFVHFFLLHGGANQYRVCRERLLSCCVLGM